MYTVIKPSKEKLGEPPSRIDLISARMNSQITLLSYECGRCNRLGHVTPYRVYKIKYDDIVTRLSS